MRPLETSDVPRVAAFLQEAFGVGADAGFASERMLTWKYIDRRGLWGEDLSYLLEKNGKLLAHAGLCPVVYRSRAGRRVRCSAIVDWAADRTVPGVGLVLYQRLMARSEATFLIGGAGITRDLVPRLGFQPTFEARVYSRWVRPLKEFRLRPKGGRALARVLHGLSHRAVDRLGGAKRGWRASPVSRFGDEVHEALAPEDDFWNPERTADELNHRLKCPATAMRGYLLLQSGKVKGYAVAGLGEWEARVLDIRLGPTSPEDRVQAVTALTHALAVEPSVCRIRVMASVPTLQRALEANGYWVNGTEPVSFYDPSGVLKSLPLLDIQFFESDLGDQLF